MLVTSRDTGRWVLPKGWPIKGRQPHQAAELEAYQEAGLLGRICKVAAGTYSYEKRLTTGTMVPCEVTVFRLEVERRRKRWPEMKERTRRWFSLDEAAEAVAEHGLQTILRRVGQPV